MLPITPTQRRVLVHLRRCEERGLPTPTYRELAKHMGWRAATSARDCVRALARRGCVRTSRLARGLALTPLGRRLASPKTHRPSDPAPVREPSSEALTLLAPYLAQRRFRAGKVLWNAGEPASIVAVIDRGQVRIFRPLPDGGEVSLYLFGPGDFFGFLPFLDGAPYPASAVATTDVRARILTRTQLFAALAERPPIAIALLQFLGLRLREAFHRIEVLSGRGSIPRVAAALAGLLPVPPSLPALVTLPMTAAMFAGTLGLAPESFSRAVTALVEARVLRRLGRGRLQVLDLAGLRAASERSSL